MMLMREPPQQPADEELSGSSENLNWVFYIKKEDKYVNKKDPLTSFHAVKSLFQRHQFAAKALFAPWTNLLSKGRVATASIVNEFTPQGWIKAASLESWPYSQREPKYSRQD